MVRRLPSTVQSPPRDTGSIFRLGHLGRVGKSAIYEMREASRVLMDAAETNVTEQEN